MDHYCEIFVMSFDGLMLKGRSYAELFRSSVLIKTFPSATDAGAHIDTVPSRSRITDPKSSLNRVLRGDFFDLLVRCSSPKT